MSRVLTVPPPAPAWIQKSEGETLATRTSDLIRDDLATPDSAWLEFCNLASRGGYKSPACCSFIKQLARLSAKAGKGPAQCG